MGSTHMSAFNNPGGAGGSSLKGKLLSLEVGGSRG